MLDSHYGVYSFRTTDNKEDTKFAVWKELVKFIEKHDYEERKKFFNISKYRLFSNWIKKLNNIIVMYNRIYH